MDYASHVNDTRTFTARGAPLTDALGDYPVFYQ